MNKLKPYGDERRVNLSDRLKSWNPNCVRSIIENPMHVLSCAFWHNYAPWYVTPRKLPNNFCLFVISGSVWLKLENEEEILQPGNAFFLKANAVHEFGLPPGQNECSHIIFHALPSSPISINLIDGLSQACHSIPFIKNETDHLLDIIAMVDSGQKEANVFCDVFLNKVMLELGKEGKLLIPANRMMPKKLSQAIVFLEHNFQEKDILVANAAEAAGIHEVQCRKLFRRHLNISPGEYLCNLRLSHAIKLLLGTSHTIKEIAWTSGFASDCYFCYVFKKHFNSTPEKYRREHGNIIPDKS